MKTRFWFFLTLVLIGFSSFTQELNKRVIDENLEKEILIGYCDRAGLMQDEFGEHFKTEYEDYSPGRKYIKKISREKTDYIIVLVLATWCHDSQIQVPRFYRILDDAGISSSLNKVICVDRDKTGGEIDITNYEVVYVPTFIFYRNGKEIGRIVESPEHSLEEDFLKIIE